MKVRLREYGAANNCSVWKMLDVLLETKLYSSITVLLNFILFLIGKFIGKFITTPAIILFCPLENEVGCCSLL